MAKLLNASGLLRYFQQHVPELRPRPRLCLAPSGMIFIPCKNGISHNEIESADPAHITAGANVLLHAMLARARVV